MGPQIENAIIQIHGWLGNTAGYYAIIMVLWGVWRFVRKQAIDSEYWGALVIEEGLILLHGLMGAGIYFIGQKWDTQPIHIIYGVASALLLPAIYGITRGKKDRKQLLIYLLFNILLAFVINLAIRASIPIMTIGE
jgi:hypothetical protein